MDGNVYKAMISAAKVRVNMPNLNIPLFEKMLVFETVLMTVQNEVNLLNILAIGSTKEMEMTSEEDISSKLWPSLLNGIINVNNRLRAKYGETKTAISTLEKSALYYNDSKVEGFKIDFRIIYDYKGKEIDLCSGEVSKSVSGKSKVYHDDSKHAREGKDLLDNLYDLNGNVEDPSLHAWTIQLSGFRCQISSQHLYSNGLYVSVPRFELEYPQGISDLSMFADLFSGLSSTILDMERLSRRIEHNLFIVSTNKPSLPGVLHLANSDCSSSTPSPSSNIDIYTHKRLTWYTLPCKDRTKSVIPPHLFGRKRFSCSGSNGSISSLNTIATSNISSVVENDKIVADEFGFYRFGDVYKNIHTGETIYDHLPHEPRE